MLEEITVCKINKLRENLVRPTIQKKKHGSNIRLYLYTEISGNNVKYGVCKIKINVKSMLQNRSLCKERKRKTQILKIKLC